MAGAAASLALGFAAAAAAAPAVYRIEPESTYAEFAVSHLGLSRQRGHFGRILRVSGKSQLRVGSAAGCVGRRFTNDPMDEAAIHAHRLEQ